MVPQNMNEPEVTTGDAWGTLGGDQRRSNGMNMTQNSVEVSQRTDKKKKHDPMCSELYHLVMTNIAMENPS